MENKIAVTLEDDDKEPEIKLIQHRLPWLALGLLGGVVATIFSSRFEALLARNISLVFFIPVIVYIADAVGTQTETIYIRDASKGKAKFSTYFIKELLIGVAVGSLFGLALGIFAYLWLKSFEVALTITLAMLVNITVAPIMALLVAKLLQKERTDPALGAGPFTTVLQDIVSLGIYFLIASLIIFK